MPSRVGALLGRNYTYPVWNRIMEIVGIGTYLVYASMLTEEVVVAFTAALAVSAEASWTVATAFLLVGLAAMFIADFVSGFVHCAADNFGTETTPIFGVAFIRPFRDHHRDPKGITHHDFVETNGNSCIVNLFVLIPTYYVVVGASGDFWSMLLAIFILMFTVMIVFTNQIHKWAHEDRPPRLVAWLQRYGIVLAPVSHQVHHTAPFDKNYCITTGWMNGVTERTGFFAWLVRAFK